ncbi:unnamed protein product [Cuscuta europaea]|uniref:Uncharacterized protein n=1 Tax=Cuscuta europaea TaxID=41803 RepID=A0A9P0Z9L7_CUSEU|nr:unnamed protein product [Cuscuta europaea]
MSLVDYASSDSDEEETELQEPSQGQILQKQVKADISHAMVAPIEDSPLHRIQKRSEESPSNKQILESTHASEPSELKLPDASFLLSSPSLPTHLGDSSDHSFRVAAAMVENATRKRDLNGPESSSYPRSKVPKGPLPHTKSFLDTGGGLLLPPQLTGRSNVVTEDISKLFVRKQDNTAS